MTRRGFAVRVTGASSPSAPAPLAAAGHVARWAAARKLTPSAMAVISLGLGIIAAAWLTRISARAATVALIAMAASALAWNAARLMGRSRAAAAGGGAAWVLAASGVLTELAAYAALAGSISANAAASGGAGLTGLAGNPLQGTFLAGLGGPGPAGAWRLAITAAALAALCRIAEACAPAPGIALHPVWLVLIAVVVVLAGARAGLALAVAGGIAAFGSQLVRPGRAVYPGVAACRGDGPVSEWIGRWVGGRLPPVAPLVVGLPVTCMLGWLGLGNLPGILILTPVEVMLLAALGSWHPHDKRGDRLVPSLLQAGEYVFLAALGFAGRVPPPLTFALVATVAVRHLDLAYRAGPQGLPEGDRPGAGRPAVDRPGLGWDGRMIVAGLAAVFGILPVVYPALAAYLAIATVRDFAARVALLPGCTRSAQEGRSADQVTSPK